MGHLGEAARDCAARRKVAMVEGVRFWHKAAAYHVNAEKKRDILCLWTRCNYKLKGFFSNKSWQIAAPSVVIPKNQYFPDNDERMSVHWREEGCIGKYTPLGPRDFPQAGILHPSALEIALGLRPRAISRASGCKINASANLSVLGGRNFHYTPPIVSVMTFFFPRRGCFDFRFWPAHCVL